MVGNKLPIRQCASLFLEFSGLGNPKAQRQVWIIRQIKDT